MHESRSPDPSEDPDLKGLTLCPVNRAPELEKHILVYQANRFLSEAEGIRGSLFHYTIHSLSERVKNTSDPAAIRAHFKEHRDMMLEVEEHRKVIKQKLARAVKKGNWEEVESLFRMEIDSYLQQQAAFSEKSASLVRTVLNRFHRTETNGHEISNLENLEILFRELGVEFTLLRKPTVSNLYQADAIDVLNCYVGLECIDRRKNRKTVPVFVFPIDQFHAVFAEIYPIITGQLYTISDSFLSKMMKSDYEMLPEDTKHVRDLFWPGIVSYVELTDRGFTIVHEIGKSNFQYIRDRLPAITEALQSCLKVFGFEAEAKEVDEKLLKVEFKIPHEVKGDYPEVEFASSDAESYIPLNRRFTRVLESEIQENPVRSYSVYIGNGAKECQLDLMKELVEAADVWIEAFPEIREFDHIINSTVLSSKRRLSVEKDSKLDSMLPWERGGRSETPRYRKAFIDRGTYISLTPEILKSPAALSLCKKFKNYAETFRIDLAHGDITFSLDEFKAGMQHDSMLHSAFRFLEEGKNSYGMIHHLYLAPVVSLRVMHVGTYDLCGVMEAFDRRGKALFTAHYSKSVNAWRVVKGLKWESLGEISGENNSHSN